MPASRVPSTTGTEWKPPWLRITAASRTAPLTQQDTGQFTAANHRQVMHPGLFKQPSGPGE
jgi:hypothetical protein